MVSFRTISSQASILLLLLFIAPSFARASNLLEQVCSKSFDPSFCLNLLGSDPRTLSADIDGIGSITIGKAKSNATETLTLIKSLIGHTNIPKMKQSYVACTKHYDIAISNINQAEHSMRKGDANILFRSAATAMNEALNCHDELEVVSPDPRIPKGNKDLENMCSVILVVAKLLPGA